MALSDHDPALGVVCSTTSGAECQEQSLENRGPDEMDRPQRRANAQRPPCAVELPPRPERKTGTARTADNMDTVVLA